MSEPSERISVSLATMSLDRGGVNTAFEKRLAIAFASKP